MAAFQNFRSAFNGFNREDVVQYIEYTNNKHASQLNQLKTELQAAQAELKEVAEASARQEELAAQLEEVLAAKAAAEAELEALRQELDSLRNTAPAAAAADPTADELAAYRRAERAERVAVERVTQMYQQANGALAEAALRAEDVSNQVTELTDRISGDVAQLKSVLTQGQAAMKSVSSSLYTIRPLSMDE